MHSFTHPLLLMFFSLCVLASASPGPPLFVPYSAPFSYPQPPVIQAEFTANFMQQKYDTQARNHITAGFAYFSLSSRKVRVDAAFNGTLQASIFDFSNVTIPGQADNTIVSFSTNVIRSQASCSSFPGIVSAFPLFTPDLLNSTNAVFLGIEHDALHGPLDAWQFLFPPNVVVTTFVDNNNTLLRYDFASTGDPLKTFSTTRFFNVVEETVSPEVFQTDCS